MKVVTKNIKIHSRIFCKFDIGLGILFVISFIKTQFHRMNTLYSNALFIAYGLHRLLPYSIPLFSWVIYGCKLGILKQTLHLNVESCYFLYTYTIKQCLSYNWQNFILMNKQSKKIRCVLSWHLLKHICQ